MVKAGPLLTLAIAAATALPASSAAADCTCRAPGREIPLGKSACLTTPQGPRLAVCVMVLNNTSWQFSETPCVSAASDAEPAIAAEGPLQEQTRAEARLP
jgi:hypothetical protein